MPGDFLNTRLRKGCRPCKPVSKWILLRDKGANGLLKGGLALTDVET